MTGSGDWTVSVRVRRSDAGAAERLLRVLAPEAAREVPRARAQLLRPEPTTVELAIVARDTGALRAALNTFLGWVSLAESTEAVVPSEGLISRPR